jgi:hypothetical protein
LRAVSAKDHVATMVGDLHRLVTEATCSHWHTAWEWDLDPLPERMLKPW